MSENPEVVHQEVSLPAAPDKVFQALMTSSQHAAFTGAPAEISADEGGAFSCHSGQIEGRNIELINGQRIVQAWRVANWDKGLYSIVRIELAAEGEGTRLVLDHSGVPPENREMISSGWHARYWEPLAKFLS